MLQISNPISPIIQTQSPPPEIKASETKLDNSVEKIASIVDSSPLGIPELVTCDPQKPILKATILSENQRETSAIKCLFKPVKEARRVRFAEDQLETPRPPFIREPHEEWALFSNICPNFPEIQSEEMAREELERFQSDPDISHFIPTGSLSDAQKLSCLYEKIMNAPYDDRLVESLYKYAKDKALQDDHFAEAIAHAISFRTDIIPENLEELKTWVFKILGFNTNANEMRTVLDTIKKCIPLEVVAKHRNAFEIFKAINDLVPEKPIYRFINVENPTKWLDDRKDYLERVTAWKIPLNIERIPHLLRSYLSHLKEVNFEDPSSEVYEPNFLFEDITKIPNLKRLHFYSPSLETSADVLLGPIQDAEELKYLSLFGTSFSSKENPKLIEYCLRKSIEMEGEFFRKDEEDRVQIYRKMGLSPPSCKLLEPLHFKNKEQDLLESKMEYLKELEYLDLSDISLSHFPLEILVLQESLWVKL